MLQFFIVGPKVKRHRPQPWAYYRDPYPVIRGKSDDYKAYIAVAGNYRPRLKRNAALKNRIWCEDDNKLTNLEKNWPILAPCKHEENERLLFITINGGFRSHFQAMEEHDAHMVFCKMGSTRYFPSAHVVVQLTRPHGFFTMTTRLLGGEEVVDVFAWMDHYHLWATEQLTFKESLEGEGLSF